MSLRQIQNPWKSDVFTTASNVATASANATFTPPAGSSGYVEMIAVARNVATNASSTLKVSYPFSNTAGTTTLGTITTLVPATTGALVAVLATIVNTANVLTPTVTGLLTTSIEWLLDVRYWVN